MTGPWKIGAWAAEAEAAEAEEAAAREEAAAAAAAAATAEPQNFPSLKESISAKPKKKKMTLTEFYTSSTANSLSSSSSPSTARGLTPDELLRLPTGPKERSAEELQHGRLGGGFSNYGRTGSIPNRSRDRDEGDNWGGAGGNRRSYGGFDEDRRGPRASDIDMPSRADEVDNWATGKKTITPMHENRGNRYGNLGLGGGSRADEVDSWSSGKRMQPPPPVSGRSSGFGSGFRDFGPGTDSDRWTRGGGFGGGASERPRLVLDPPKANNSDSGLGGNETVKSNRANPFGEARPREQVLAEKGLDYKKLDLEIEAKKTVSRPTSSQSSRPSSAHSARSESVGQGVVGGGGLGIESVVVKPRPKVNPFGDAKPREVLLEEKGKDWRKMDFELEHRRVDRPETEQEKMLREEIDKLKREREELVAKGNGESSQGLEGDNPDPSDIISQKERDLELLIRELDDKVRFGQKAAERPGSASGRVNSFSERPSSRSGSIDESRSIDYNDRPSSRGSGDAWLRAGGDRRTYQGGRDRGFLANRDSDRSRTRGRW